MCCRTLTNLPSAPLGTAPSELRAATISTRDAEMFHAWKPLRGGLPGQRRFSRVTPKRFTRGTEPCGSTRRVCRVHGSSSGCGLPERIEPAHPDCLVRITLKRPYADGIVAVDMDPLSLLCRLATSVPPSRAPPCPPPHRRASRSTIRTQAISPLRMRFIQEIPEFIWVNSGPTLER